MTRVNFLAYVKRTFKRDDKDTEIYEAEDETIKDVAGRHSFQVLREISYASTVVGQVDYPLPSNLLHMHHPVRLLDGSGTNDTGRPLTQVSEDRFHEICPNPFRTSPPTGKPYAYTIARGQLLLVDIPDSADYLLEISRGKEPTLPTADGDDAHPFGTQWDETIKWGVLARVYEGIGMEEESDRWGQMFEMGKPILIGGQIKGYQGGVANMIAHDRRQTSAPQFVQNNAL